MWFMIAIRCWWSSLLQYSILNLKAVFLSDLIQDCLPKIGLSTTRASQQPETSKDLHLPKLYPNQMNPIIPSHPTMPRGYSLHLPWPVADKEICRGQHFPMSRLEHLGRCFQPETLLEIDWFGLPNRKDHKWSILQRFAQKFLEFLRMKNS